MPIINSMITSGVQPSGTKTITSNGVVDVTNYASADVQVPTTAPTYYLELGVDSSETLVKSGSSLVNLNGVSIIGDSVLMGAYQNSSIAGILDFSGIVRIKNNGMNSSFSSCYNVTGVKFDNLTTIDSSGCYNCFYGCSHITGKVDLSSLTTVGNSSCINMFYNCTGITSVDMSALENIVNAGCENMFYNCSGITSIDISALKKVTVTGGFLRTFFNCTSLTSVNFASLEEINGSWPVGATFEGCSNLTTAYLPSLKILKGQYAIQKLFKDTKLTDLRFPALNTDSFTGGGTNQFNIMLQGVTGCTVHFPIAIQNTIGSWSDVVAGFGGTNTTVSFDIVSSITGADNIIYTRKEKDATSSAMAWIYNDVIYYTLGLEPNVGDTIYSDAACTTAVTTIDSIA